MQVIFLVCSDVTCYLRLSDGKHVTPIIFLLKTQFNPHFAVGAVIAINEVSLNFKNFLYCIEEKYTRFCFDGYIHYRVKYFCNNVNVHRSLLLCNSMTLHLQVHFVLRENRTREYHPLEDQGSYPLIIKSFTLLETHSSVGQILGSLDYSASYRDAIKHVHHILVSSQVK